MATVKFYLRSAKDKSGALRKDEVSILAKFTLSREQRFELPTSEKIIPRLWDGRGQCAKSNAHDHVNINLYLADFKRNLITLWRENREMPFEQFKSLARLQTTGTAEKKTLFTSLAAFIKQYELEKDEKTVRRYTAMRNFLEEYAKATPIDFVNLDYNFYDSFRAFLYGKNQIDSTMYKYITNLKTFLKWAGKRGYQVNEIYKEWTTIKRVNKPISLTLQELEQLQNAQLPPHLQLSVDFLLLECYTGQRISDLQRFDMKNYSNYKWTFFQKKGNRISSKRITVHFTGYSAPALLILAKYNFVLPSITDKTINKNVKLGCEKAGIKTITTKEYWKGGTKISETKQKWEFITTHTGRKTFITLALQYMPPKVVKDLAGIDSYQTLKHYEADSDDRIVEEHLEQMQLKMKAI